jgi:hypothetical protein
MMVERWQSDDEATQIMPSLLATFLQDRRVVVSVVTLLSLYLAMVVGYQRTVPIFEAPDEQSHIHYVAFVSLEGHLPRYGAEPDVPGEGMQPPLYYILLAPLFQALDPGGDELLEDLRQASHWIYETDGSNRVSPMARIRPATRGDGVPRFAPEPSLDPLRKLRWGTLPFGFIALLFTIAGAWCASRNAPVSILCGALLGFSPQFLFMSSYVSNDAAGACIGAAAFWLFSLSLDRERDRRYQYLLLAMLVALGAAVKNSTLPVLAVTALGIVAMDPRPTRTRIRAVVMAGAIAFVLLLPNALSNIQRFGDPLGLDALWQSAAGLPRTAEFGSTASYFVQMYWFNTLRSYWGVFGWMDLHVPASVWLSSFALTAVGTVGFVLALKRPDASGDSRLKAPFLYVAAAALATVAIHVLLNMRLIQPQGRHLFAAAPHIAFLLATGIAHWTTARREWLTTWGVAAGLLGLALYCLVAVIAPAYAGAMTAR